MSFIWHVTIKINNKRQIVEPLMGQGPHLQWLWGLRGHSSRLIFQRGSTGSMMWLTSFLNPKLATETSGIYLQVVFSTLRGKNYFSGEFLNSLNKLKVSFHFSTHLLLSDHVWTVIFTGECRKQVNFPFFALSHETARISPNQNQTSSSFLQTFEFCSPPWPSFSPANLGVL